jgi:hypothetical protein
MCLTKEEIDNLKPLLAEPVGLQPTPIEDIKEIPTLVDDIIERVKYYPTSIPALVPVVAYILKYYTGIDIPNEVILAVTGTIWGLLKNSK